jgi:hypothetical protein
MRFPQEPAGSQNEMARKMVGGICSTAVTDRSGCQDAETLSGQASGEKVEAKSLWKLFNYKSRLFTKTRAMAKKISAALPVGCTPK